MHKRFLSALTAAVFMICSLGANAAVIDHTTPYSGDYLLAINTSTDGTSQQYSGSLSTGQAGAYSKELETLPVSMEGKPGVVGVREESGLRLEQLDPGRLLAGRENTENAGSGKADSFQSAALYAASYKAGDQKNFSTVDFTYNPPIDVNKTFTLKYAGSKCNIWLENGSAVGLTASGINSLGIEFDNNIYPNMTENFGTGYDKDQDGKTAIILYDIQDGWNGTTEPGYIAGFFDSYDLSAYGNNMDMMHVDTYPGMGINPSNPDAARSAGTIAHEYQHLINYSYAQTHSPKLEQMPLWLNEGLSMAAEHMLYGPLDDRISYFNDSSSIQNGHSLFYWDSSGDVMSNYSLSYLFLQYLACQTKGYSGGGTAIFKTVIQSGNRTSTVVQDIMRQFFTNITLNDIQINFKIATVLLEPEGPYGFGNNDAFGGLRPRFYIGGGLDLQGGGAVIKQITSPVTPAGYGPSMKFIGFTREKVSAPAASPGSGTVASGTQVTLSCATSGASIRYTLDGTAPTSSSGTLYSLPITITADTTVKAIAYKSGMGDSDVAVIPFTIHTGLPAPVWKVKCGYDSSGVLHALATVPDGFVAAGYSSSFGVAQKGYRDAVIIKYSADGNELWRRGFGGADYDEFLSIAADGDHCVAAGYSNAFGSGDWEGVTGKGYADAIIVKYDSDGNIIWKKNFGGSDTDYFTSVCAAEDGYIAAGYSAATGAGDWEGFSGRGGTDAIIVKFDVNGNVVWKKIFGGASADCFYGVAAEADGYIACGGSYPQSLGTGDFSGMNGRGGTDAIAVKFDVNGNVVWKRHFGGSSTDIFRAISVLKDGYVLAGESHVFNDGDWSSTVPKGYYDAMIVKLDNNGSIVWKKNFGGSGGDYFNSVTEAAGGYIANGFSESVSGGDWAGITSKGGNDAIVVKFDTNGNVVWKNNFGGAGDDRYRFVKAIIGGFVAVGSTTSSGGDLSGVSGYGGCVIVKYDDLPYSPIDLFSCASYGLYSGTKQLLTFPGEGGAYTFKAGFVNTAGQGLDITFALVIKNDAKVLGIRYIPKENVPAGQTADLSLDILLPPLADAPGLVIKLLALSGFENLTPLNLPVVMERSIY